MTKHIECKNILIKVNDEVVGVVHSLDIEKIDDKIIVNAKRIRLTADQIKSAFYRTFSMDSQYAPLQIICDDQFNTIIQNAWIINSPTNPSYSVDELIMYEQVEFHCEKIILQ